MNEREKWVFAIKFFNQKRNPLELVMAKQWQEISAVLHFVRAEIPNHYALSDPSLYKQVMTRIIDLRLKGWANEHWKMYDEYAKDPTEFERVREYFKNVTYEQIVADNEELRKQKAKQALAQ